MKTNSKNILPVLLGGDLNAYSVALAFHEAYGVTSHAFVRYKCGITENSKFIKTHVCTDVCDVKVAVSVLLKFAAENTGAELFLIPCSDPYVELLERIRGHLEGIYRIDVPDEGLWRRLSDKCEFYESIGKAGIVHPPYVAFSSAEEIDEKKLCEFEYPAVMKPSDSSEYWRYPFQGMKKVYFPIDAAQAREIALRIFKSGYGKKVILQRKVGKESSNRVLTTYSDRFGRVVRAVLGEVVLMECGVTSYGNHTAIITVPLDEMSFQLIDFLNSVKYNGFANFDIMAAGKEKYVLELNARQGRSCDYLRAAGVNIAELTVKNSFEENIQPEFSYREIYWHYPPHKTVMRCCDEIWRGRITDLCESGAEYTPLENEYEGFLRRLYVNFHNKRLSKVIEKSILGER